MLNQVEVAIQSLRSVATDQTNRIRSEINTAVDTMSAAKIAFVSEMDTARRLQEKAQQTHIEACLAFDTAISNVMATLLSIDKQLADGEMITGTLPAPAKPRLVENKASG